MSRIPVGAKPIAEIGGVVHVDAHGVLVDAHRRAVDAHRRKVVVTLYEGHASDGYKTDYRRRPARWVEWKRWNDDKVDFVYVKRYTGGRFAAAERDFNEAAQVFRDDPTVTLSTDRKIAS